MKAIMKGIITILLMAVFVFVGSGLLITYGCSNIHKETRTNQYYQSVDEILEMFQKNRSLFDEVARLLTGNDDFWNNLRLQSAGKSLDINNKKHAAVYEGYYSEKEWSKVKKLFLNTNAHNFNFRSTSISGGNKQELIYAVFTYRYISHNHLVQFYYAELRDGVSAPKNAMRQRTRFGTITQLDDYWYYEVWDVVPD